jgi:hypothetical protein
MQTWIFQGNPDDYDIDGYLASAMPEIVIKAKETPTPPHRIGQEAKQMEPRTIGCLVTCRLRQSNLARRLVPECWHANLVIARQKFRISRRSLGEMLFKDAFRFLPYGRSCPPQIAALPLVGVSCQRLSSIPLGCSLPPRSQSDSRNSLGVIPVHRLKAWVKELTS